MARIVVGVDGSSISDLALQWAAREAELHGWPLTALLAWGYLDQHHASADADFDTDYDRDDAVAALDAYVTRALGPSPAVEVERREACELPARALLAAADDATLLVVGAKGHSAVAGFVLGSVTRALLHHARTPLAIVRATPTTGGGGSGRIVVGVDGSDGSRTALAWAAEEARVRQASLEVVLAWHLPYVGGLPYTGNAFDPALLEDEARQNLDRLVDAIDAASMAQPVERVLTLGDAASGLLASAEGADLVVVGSRGLGGFAGLLLGSVSHHVALHAPCPVVVVPPSPTA